MGAYQCWVAQREHLREGLATTGDAAGAAYLTRHTLSQVEQNAMAEQTDDLLRQQLGILFSCVKTSLNLLDISVTARVWVAQETDPKARKRAWAWLLVLGLGALAACGVFAYLSAQWALLTGLIAAVALGATGFLLHGRVLRQQSAIDDDRVKVTAKPDAEKLFQAIDAQMRAIDRYMNDFAYLNEQTALTSGAPDHRNIAALAELMQAVYEAEGEAGDEATVAAERLLGGMGVLAVRYAPQEQRLFTVLPSISETRTLAPALVSAKDGALLLRGTAAVCEPLASTREALNVQSAQPEPPRSEA